jgi:hypothetical protein
MTVRKGSKMLTRKAMRGNPLMNKPRLSRIPMRQLMMAL